MRQIAFACFAVLLVMNVCAIQTEDPLEELLGLSGTPGDVPPLLDVEATNATGSVDCFTCQYVVGFAETKLQSNATESEIEAELNKICSDLPAEKALCQKLVQAYLPQVVAAIVAQAPPKKVCTLVGMCNATNRLQSVEVTTERGNYTRGPKCSVCHLAAEFLATREHSDEDTVCNDLPIFALSTCQEMLKHPRLQSLLVARKSADEVCASLDYCTTTSVPVVTITRTTDLTAVEDRLPDGQSECEVGMPCDVKCDACELAVKWIESAVESNASETRISEALSKVCTYLPSSFSQQCRDLVQAETPQLIKFIEAELTPSLVCTKLHQCAPSVVSVSELEMDQVGETPVLNVETTRYPVPHLDELRAKAHAAFREKLAADEEQCSMCQVMMAFLESQITNPTNEKKLEKLLSSVCNFMDAPMKSLCKIAVETYAPSILDILVKKESPQRVCTTLKMCHNASNTLDMFSQCDVCQLAMRWVEGATAAPALRPPHPALSITPPFIDPAVAARAETANPEEAQLRVALKQVCLNLPVPSRAGCDSLVNISSLPGLVLEAKHSGHKLRAICRLGNQCPHSTMILRQRSIKAHLHTLMGGELCPMCEFITHFLINGLPHNASDVQVKKALSHVCGPPLPEDDWSSCSEMVEAHQAQMVALLSNRTAATAICHKIEQCKDISFPTFSTESRNIPVPQSDD